MRVLAVSAAVLCALSACSGPEAAPPPVATSAPSATASSVASAPAAAPPAVAIARDGVRFEGVHVIPIEKDPSAGADAKHKRNGPNDLYLSPLAGALEKARAEGRLPAAPEPSGAELGVVVEPDVPYRLLMEVLFTAGQTKFGRYVIREGAGSARTVVTEPPSAGRLSAVDPDVPRLNITVVLADTGIVVKTSRGNVAPGCREPGKGTTVPLVEGKHDFAALSACAARLKAGDAAFTSEQSYTLTASAGTPFSDVVSVVEALRQGAGLPTVFFGISKW